MELFAPILLCAVFLVIMYGLMRLSLYLSNLLARRSVYKSGVYTAKTVHTLLITRFGEKNILSGKFLPRNTENGAVYEKYDHILLLGGAAVIVKICREDGKIQNLTFGEAWNTRVRTRSGGERELSFENPLIAGKRKAKALSKVFENAKCAFPIPVKYIVIFPSRRVSFSLPRQKELMSPPEALRALAELNKTEKFTKEQKKAMKNAIRRFSKTESQINAKKAKTRHR